MTTLLKNGTIVNVFTGELEQKDVLISDKKIIGVGSYSDACRVGDIHADVIEDVSGKYICPSFIDGHIHIESTMLQPKEFARECIPHGTGAVIADPHEIANVCGVDGINFMLQASENLPMKFYFMLPSCVPATSIDENGATISASDLEPLYKNERVLGLGEMMNYPGVINEDADVMEKIHQAQQHGKIVNGHAPLLSGNGLDKYIAAGIRDDHECTVFTEAVEKLQKGMWIMIREGTSAKDLSALINLFEKPYNHRCLLVTDDKHAYDLVSNGHIDAIIRKAVGLGKNPITAIQMATIQAALCFNLKNIGAVAPGYDANLLVLNDLNTVAIEEVFYEGVKVFYDKQMVTFEKQKISQRLVEHVDNSFHVKHLEAQDFLIEPKKARQLALPQSSQKTSTKCRVIELIADSLITNEVITEIDFNINNGVDVKNDIIKLAVCERHKMTGHIGLGFIKGSGIKEGAIASSVSHDNHNLIIIGTNENDMALAGNAITEMGGGLCVVRNGEVLAKLQLHIAGLMSDHDAATVVSLNEQIRKASTALGVNENIEPFMHMAFVSLPVIPNLKMTTRGLIDVNKQELVPLQSGLSVLRS